MKTLIRSRLWTNSLAAILGLSFLISSTSAEARVTFKAPLGLGVPGRRVAGGSAIAEQLFISEPAFDCHSS